MSHATKMSHPHACEYRPWPHCKRCGSGLYEISLVPRSMRVLGDGIYGEDVAYWEAEQVIAYGCDNERCEYWQGNYGAMRCDGDTCRAEGGPDLYDIVCEGDA